MPRNTFLSAAIVASACLPIAANAAENTELQALGDEVKKLQQSNELRLAQLEQAAQAEAPSSQGGGRTGSFTPAISLTLGGIYGSMQQDPTIPATGFAMNPGPEHARGFSLGETEVDIAANIDPDFRGVAIFALDPANGASVENAFVQTTALGNGLTVKFGRHFSGLGYLNDKHVDIWDFADQPLVYAVFWENQLADDGVQIEWVAPADTYVQIGGELGRGRGFPGSDRDANGAGSRVLFAHLGDDLGIEHSWRTGVSLHGAKRENALSDGVPDVPGTSGGVSNLFSGDSRTVGADFVWKYAPSGNLRNRSVTLQAEFFRRNETGMLTYDTAGANVAGNYAVTQSGWYMQGAFRFLPAWRAGLRYDRLDPGIARMDATLAANVVHDYGYRPSRVTGMLDYSPSQFSRLRLQLARDQSRVGMPDNQLFLQYVMNLGAHGAHQY